MRHEDAFVHATLTDARRPPHAMERLRSPVPAHAGASRSSQPTATDAATGRDARSRVLGRTDTEVMTNFFTDVRSSSPDLRGAGPARSSQPMPAGTTRTSHHEGASPGDHGVRPVPRHRSHRLRRAQRVRLLPAHRPDRRRQDQHPRRDLLRPVRGCARGPQQRQGPQESPRRSP